MMKNEIVCGDSFDVLQKIENDSIDACVTDPPYFIHGLDNKLWDTTIKSTKNSTIKSLSSGMKFDKEQSKQFYDWYVKICKEILRVLKPGSFFFSFSSPRLYHRMACAVEDAGFLIKDQFIWLYVKSQPKAMSLNHVIDRLKIPDSEKESLKDDLSGWKTPQLKSCHEPIVMAQKSLDGSFLDNYQKHGVGLVDTNLRVGEGMFPSNVASTQEFDEMVDRYFLVSKPGKKEKGEFNFHKTVKPVDLCTFLISLTTRENDLVLDPFLGSGTTAVAAKQSKRNFIGIDLNPEYVTIAKQRLNELTV